MDFRIFWIIYLLCIGVMLAAVAGCGGGGEAQGGLSREVHLARAGGT